MLVGSLTLPAFAGEYAVLANGSRIHADRHEAEGGRVRLFAGPAVTEMQAALIAGFEAEEFVPAPVKPQAGFGSRTGAAWSRMRR